MEEENEVIKQKKNDHYFGGIIGAILGGIVGAIPWTLLYVFASLNSALLAILVGLGAIKGYTLFKGKVTNKTKIIVSLISLLILVGVDLIGLPLIYTVTYSIDLEAFYTEMRAEIIQDLIFTLLFGVFGIFYAISSINKILAKQKITQEGKNENVSEKEQLRKAEIDNSLSNEKKKEIEILRRVFERLNALNKKTAVEKQIILEEFEKENIENTEKLFKKYKNLDIIRKSKGKFYYSSKSEVFASKNYWIWFIIIIVIAIMTNAMNDTQTDTDYNDIANSVVSQQGETLYDFKGENITITVPEEFSIIEEDGYWFIEKDDCYAVIYLYDRTELVDGIALEDCIISIEDYIYGIYETEEKTHMELYPDLNKKTYKLSFNSVEDIYKVKVNSYLTETENYIFEMHVISEANTATENEPKYENMINSLVEKNSVEE